MEIRENENLKKYTTVKIGGTASKFYIPETEAELINLVNELKDEKYYILGGGSNILMDDKKVFSHVIHMLKFNNAFEDLGGGRFYAGASVRLQKFITSINETGHGGIEYLFSVPGSLGGAILMNAGRGRKYNKCISDYIIKVDVLKDGKKVSMDKSECGFSYRNSVFKGSDMIVLGAEFEFPKFDKEYLAEERKKRMEFSKTRQDYSGSNFGTVFCKSNPKAMGIVKVLHPGYKNGVCFSKKTSNWILNKGNGNFEQALKVIKKAKRINRLFGTEAELEVIVWD